MSIEQTRTATASAGQHAGFDFFAARMGLTGKRRAIPEVVDVEHGFTAPSGSQSAAATGAGQDAGFDFFAARMGLTGKGA